MGENMKEAVRTASVVDNVEDTIYSYIKDNGLVPGDKLPSELDLAEMFGVGRNAVREALSRMRASGILESRKKRGIVIRTMDVSKNLDKIFYPEMLDRKTIVDLLELRIWLEKAIVPSVFSRITDEDIRDLERILSHESHSADGRIPISDELAFHSRINSITGNAIVANLQDSLLPVYRYVHDNIEDFSSNKDTAGGHVRKASHEQLLEALKERDADKYLKLISRHLIAYERYVKSQKQTS